MKSLSHHLVLVFVIGFLLIFSLYAGLPCDFSADLLRDEVITQANSYGQLICYILNPLTPAWFFYGKMEELRPIVYLLHKIYFEAFGMNLVTAHITAALAHGILAVVFFLMVFWFTRRKLYAWLLVILYASFPTNAMMLAGNMAYEIQFFLSVITLGGVTAFVSLTWSEKSSVAKKILLTLIWIFSTWVSVKWKSSEKILPFIFLGFLILRQGAIQKRIGRGAALALVMINLFLFILVVPIRSYLPGNSEQTETVSGELYKQHATKEKKMTHFTVSHLLARTFHLPGSENPLLKPTLDEMPASFTGDLGFFLGWFFWLSLLALPFLWRKTWDQVETHASTLVILWFLAVVAGFSSGQELNEIRYLNFALVPAILLLASQIRLLEDSLKAGSFIRRQVFPWALTGIFIFTFIQNFGFLTKWVGHFGGIQYALFESDKRIYEALSGKIPTDIEIYKSHGDLEKRVVLVNWYDLKEDWFEDAVRRLERENALFIKTRDEEDEKVSRFREAGFAVEKLETFLFYDAKPLFFRWSRLLGRLGLRHLKLRQVILYRIIPNR